MVKVINPTAKAESEGKGELLASTTASVSAANPLAIIETTMAKADVALSAAVHELIVKAQEVASGPLTVLAVLQDSYGDDLSQFFPRTWGSKKEQMDAKPNDPILEFFKGPKLNKEGKVVEKDCNFFTEGWNVTTEGKAQVHILTHVNRDGTVNDNAPKEFKDMDAIQRKNLYKRTSNAHTRGRSWLRKAVQIYWVMSDLAAYTDHVSLEQDTSGETTDVPMNLVNKHKVRDYRPMAVGDVTKLDVRLAVIDCGAKLENLYDRLIAQLARNTGTPGGDEATFDKFDDMLSSMRCFNNYFDIGSEDGKSHVELLDNYLNRKGEAAASLLMEWFTFVSNVKATWNPQLETRAKRLREKQIEAGELDEAPALKKDAA